MFDTNKLEQLLIANWANFFNVSKLLKFAKSGLPEKYKQNRVKNLTISRFEIIDSGFLVWLEVNVHTTTSEVSKTSTNITMECHLSNRGILTLDKVF